VSVDPQGLGALLVLLHGADAPIESVEASYRVWRHHDRAHAAFIAHAEEQERRGASIQRFGAGQAEAAPAEHEETVRIWRAGERARVERHGGHRDGYYAVVDGPLWWMWDEHMGARSNQGNPEVGGNFGEELQIMLNPISLLSLLRFEPTGTSQVAGRPSVTAQATPRPRDLGHVGGFELHELGIGAERYELELDQQRGVLLAATAVRHGQPFNRVTALAVRFDEPISDEMFRFLPPAGEALQPLHDEHRVEWVTLTEAQQRAPFTVLMPDAVPANWQVQCRFVKSSERPPSPVQVGVMYRSTDGHESVSLSQSDAEGPSPYRQMGEGDDWEDVSRAGIPMKARPARWGQAQVELEMHGTFVHLMSDNLTRDQVLAIAGRLRPAPSASSI
jgi:hypothetical protein